MSNNQNNQQEVPQVKSVEHIPMTENEKYLIRQIKSIQESAIFMSLNHGNNFARADLMNRISLIKTNIDDPIYVSGIPLRDIE